jgi:hypothetical protein
MRMKGGSWEGVMEQSEGRTRDERWLDLLYGRQLEPESGLLINFTRRI